MDTSYKTTANVIRIKSWRKAIPVVLDDRLGILKTQREPIFRNVANEYVEDQFESDLLIKLSDNQPKPFMLTSLLILQFNSYASCYEAMTELKLNHLVCHEHQLRFTKRDLRSKINLMEMDRPPLKYRDEKPTRIDTIERLRWRV